MRAGRWYGLGDRGAILRTMNVRIATIRRVVRSGNSEEPAAMGKLPVEQRGDAERQEHGYITASCLKHNTIWGTWRIRESETDCWGCRIITLLLEMRYAI